MLLSKLTAVASVGLLLSFSLAAVGCAAPAETTSEGSAALVNDEGDFKLYDEAVSADPQCDLHTVLNLAHQRIDGALRARLADAAEGVCRINVAPDAREYVLVSAGDDCGSKIYTGKSLTSAGTIRITDNRARLCNDYVPAIVVEEQGAKGAVRTLSTPAQ
jgi:hypothetical protein